jgi:hypothetical protein
MNTNAGIERDMEMAERTITNMHDRNRVLAAINVLADAVNENSHAAGFYDPPQEVRELHELRRRLEMRDARALGSAVITDIDRQIIEAAIAKLSLPNLGEKLALMHSELSELLEGHRHRNPPSDHIPEFSAAEEEAADLLIRLLDTAREEKWRIGEAVLAKMDFNATRPYKHGKTC